MGLKLVVPIGDPVKILIFFHDNIGNWDLKSTRKLFLEGFWWRSKQSGATGYVRSCDPFQKMKPFPKYASKLYRPLIHLFEVF